MDVLYLSHCCPTPLDSSDGLRAHQEIQRLAACHRVHVACFVRRPEEIAVARRLESMCASLYVEPLRTGRGKTKAALRFVLGGSFSASLYRSAAMNAYVRDLMRRARPSVTVAYSSVMARYAVDGLPLVLDLPRVGDVASVRAGFARGIDARRLRRYEAWYATRARRTLVASAGEAASLKRIAPRCSSAVMENGVDFERFDPARIVPPASLLGRSFVLVTRGEDTPVTLKTVRWVAQRVLPEVSRRGYSLELASPIQYPRGPRRLPDVPGVLPPVADADAISYLAAARAVIAPGTPSAALVQSVMEALAMGKPVLASPAVCDWFGSGLPRGVCRCHHPAEYAEALLLGSADATVSYPHIREHARRRFSWHTNLEVLEREVQAALRSVNPFMFAAVP